MISSPCQISSSTTTPQYSLISQPKKSTLQAGYASTEPGQLVQRQYGMVFLLHESEPIAGHSVIGQPTSRFPSLERGLPGLNPFDCRCGRLECLQTKAICDFSLL